MRRHARHPAGFSLAEVLLVVVISGVMLSLALPAINTARDGAARRAARQQLSAAFAATRGAALQKGKSATLTLTAGTATVSVLSGIASTATTVLGPIRFDSTLNASIAALNGAPTTVAYSARGLLTPTPVSTQKYQISIGTLRDTVCVSPAGVILPKGCQL